MLAITALALSALAVASGVANMWSWSRLSQLRAGVLHSSFIHWGTVGGGREVLGRVVVGFGADWLEVVGGVVRTDWSSSFAEYHCPFSAR